MSYAIIKVVYGVPKTEEICDKLAEWESADDERWYDGDHGTSGFTDLYSAGGPGFGYCGVELDELSSYGQDLVSAYKFTPTEKQKKEAEELVAALDPELRKMAGPVGVYFIWSDA
jgi:hypothetical protein